MSSASTHSAPFAGRTSFCYTFLRNSGVVDFYKKVAAGNVAYR